MANHAAGDLADRDVAADFRALLGADAGAGQRQIEDPHPDIGAVRHDQPGAGDLWHETAVAAVFRQVEDAAVGEPGELGGKHVALSRRRRDRHRKAVLQLAGDLALQAAEMVHVSNDAVADCARNRRDQGDAAGRYIDDLAGKFAAICQHVAAEQADADALMSPALLRVRQRVRFGLQ